MSKESDALGRIRENLTRIRDSDDSPYLFEQDAIDLGILEAALVENSELKRMIGKFNQAIGEPTIITPSIEKKLEALEIIKKKNVHINSVKICDNAHQYNILIGLPYEKRLTKYEFDLVKAVLS